jgi:receptor protein-tyrosine kinase
MSIIEKAVDKLEKKSALDPTEPEVPAISDVEAISISSDNPSHDSSVEVHATPPSDAGEIVNIPFERFKGLGIITPDMPRSRIAEEYRSIKRPLLSNIAGKGAAEVDNINVIMVTSALQGEGKTFTSINLALSIAMELDKTVLFIDADISNPKAAALLGIKDSEPGLVDILEDKGTRISDVMLSTNLPNLRIIPAGHISDKANELLSSENMYNLIRDLSNRFSDRVIIVDTPPLLETTEASILASLIGQIVIVVEAEKTSQEAVKEALQHIAGDKIVNMVLNKNRKHRMRKYSGYGYGYGYGNAKTRPVSSLST